MTTSSSPVVKIIGGGQLGSRHLQALAAVKTPLQIEVIDPSEAALRSSEDRFFAMAGAKRHSIRFSASIQKVADRQLCDFLIVATGARPRLAVLKEALESWTVRGILLEKLLFTQLEDYNAGSQLLEKNPQTKAWVNCAMRQMPVYQEIKERVHSQNLCFDFSVTGSMSQYGLMTTAIHYIDLFSWMAGESKPVSVDIERLDTQLHQAKRTGYHELTGTIKVSHPDGSTGRFSCSKVGNAPALLAFQTPLERWFVREAEGKLWNAFEPSWQWEEKSFQLPYQSQLTTMNVESFLATGEVPYLPTWRHSFRSHLALVEPISKWLASQDFDSAESFPFT